MDRQSRKTHASVVIWIVKRARDEHRQAIEWLNQHTDEQIGFFLVEIELWQIDDSAFAPMFKVVERPNDWAKEIKKVSATSNATQQARLEYWTAFNNYAFANKTFAKEFKQRKPSTDHWMSLSVGTSSCGLSILRLQQQSQVGVEFNVYSDKDLFRMLHGHKQEIEEEIGAELDWRELPEKKVSRILIKRDANLTDEQEWPQQFEWIMNKLVKMKKAFKKYI